MPVLILLTFCLTTACWHGAFIYKHARSRFGPAPCRFWHWNLRHGLSHVRARRPDFRLWSSWIRGLMCLIEFGIKGNQSRIGQGANCSTIWRITWTLMLMFMFWICWFYWWLMVEQWIMASQPHSLVRTQRPPHPTIHQCRPKSCQATQLLPATNPRHSLVATLFFEHMFM